MKLVGEQSPKTKIFFNLIVLVLALLSISRDGELVGRVSPFERLMIDSFAPMQRSVSYFKEEIAAVFRNYFLNVGATKENTVLKKKVVSLTSQIDAFAELEQENVRLKKLLKFGEEIPYKKVLAQIVAWDSSSDFRVIRINKGHSHGVKLQSTVVTDEGVVGYVIRLTNNFSDILTILDSNNRIDAIVSRTRTHGIVEGFSSGTMVMKYVPTVESIIVNDLVLTSGLGNVYPKGLKLGRVSKIEKENFGITQHIEITPSVNFAKLEEVIVLLSPENQNKRVEWKALDSAESE